MQKAANPAPGFRQKPSHRITVEPFGGTVTVSFSDAVIASSQNAKVLREGDYPPVFYIPFEDIYFDFLQPTETRTHCPYKGEASYWSVSAVGEGQRDVMWAYLSPYDEMQAIKGHGAFYPDRVRVEASD
jgi:uncharacterized protein (DUF427 family)